MKEPISNTVLILYSEIFSSEENLDYWKNKLDKQLDENCPFGLVAVIPESYEFHRVSRNMTEKYKTWINTIRPALESKCYGYAIVSSNQTHAKKYSHYHLNQIKSIIGADCSYFLELQEAIEWLGMKPKKEAESNK